MKKINKLLSLLLFSFFLSIQISAATYEDAEPTNDICPGESLSTVTSGSSTFTGTLEKATSGANAVPGIDYSVMSIPNDGNITISLQSDDSSYKGAFLVGSSCNDDGYYDGSLTSHIHTLDTFLVSQGDLIYLKIYNGDSGNTNTDRGYSINIDYVIDIPDVDSSLQITKIDSDDPVKINEAFYYIIDVSNKGETNASGVVVLDTLPKDVDMNQSETDAASIWDCDQDARIVECTYPNDIPSGETQTIYLHVNAPSTAGTITNDVNVTDNNGSSDTSSEQTVIVAEVENAENLCYIENTIASKLNADINASCEKRGNFFYGDIGGQDDCIAQVVIMQDTNVSTDAITGLQVTKMYAPGLTSKGFAEANLGTVLNSGKRTTLNFPSFTSYKEGYIVKVDASLTKDNNLTIKDTASDYSPNINGIAMYGDYNISGVHHFGRIYACDGGSEGGIIINFSADTIDTHIGTNAGLASNYNTSKSDPNNINTTDDGDNITYIRTMVAKDTSRAIEGVHLDENGLATPYTPSNPKFNFIISASLVSDNCDGAAEPVSKAGTLAGTTDPLFIVIPPDAYSATGYMAVDQIARKATRMQLVYVDPDSLSVDGQQCILSSSIDGNFAGVPSCANSEVQYSDAFGQDAWDRCGIDSGLPCVSSNHGIADVDDETYDPLTDSIYVNPYGCYLCTFNVQPVCSTDNFAIRPDRFVGGITDADAPNLLRASETYSTSLTATNPDNTVTTSYSAADTTVFDTNTSKYFKSDWGVLGPIAPAPYDDLDIMNGESGFNPIGTPSMIAGLSHDAANSSADPDPILDLFYTDVGEVTFYVIDKDWAYIDFDDTPDDCNSSEHYYICSEQNLTFIPDHFAFDELNITNHAGPDDSNFTYIADKRGMTSTMLSTTPLPRGLMAARVHTKIVAYNKNDEITKNFREDVGGDAYYENPITVTLDVEIPPESDSGTNKYLYPDANESNILTQEIGFGRDDGGTDDKGTRNIKWDESTYPLGFNFQREIDELANPFVVDGQYLAISVLSTYTQTVAGKNPSKDIEGSRLGDYVETTDNARWTVCTTAMSTTKDCNNSSANALEDATFYYGKTRPSKAIYDYISTPVASTPIAIDIYCDLGYTACDNFDIDTVNGQTNDFGWWLSWEHSKNRGDGNVTVEIGTITEGAGSPSISSAGVVSVEDEGVDNTVTVTSNATTLPMRVEIDLVIDDTITNFTNEWLIYNKNGSYEPSPFYEVHFIGTSGWTGEGKTAHILETNASNRSLNRLEW